MGDPLHGLRVALHPFDMLLLAAPVAVAAARLHWDAAVLFSRRPAPIRARKEYATRSP
jgi:hypothetical protein